jgi:hypothetical protein
MKRLTDHIARHPIRTIVTIMVPLIATSLLAVYAIAITVHTNRERDRAICAQVNDLRESIYLAIIDFYADVPPALRQALAERFLPEENCEDLS